MSHNRRSSASTVDGSARRVGAFTLVEILVVIVIIGILATIALVVGVRVTKGGERSLTENTLRTLDATLTSWQSDREAKFPTYFVDGQGRIFPIVDGRRDGQQGANFDAPAEPTIALYLEIARQAPAVQETLKSIDQKLIKRGPITSGGVNAKDRNNNDIEGTFINDAWGNPIRFVLPRFHGGHGPASGIAGGRGLLQFRQDLRSAYGNLANIDVTYSRSYRPWLGNTPSTSSVGDADEGLCPGGRPYFYSAGPDGDPGTREDNVYSIQPQFPLETRDLK